MENEIMVSVCCVTYNHVNYISQALDGFLMQKTSFPIEIIVHDDASTDGTTDIILEYQTKHPGIIKPIIQKENQWSKGRKITPIAMAQANGKYIALCEGDDYWTDHLKLQKQVDFLEANSEYSGSFHETPQIGVVQAGSRVFGKTEKDFFTVEDTISTLSPFHTSSFVFRKEFLPIPDWFCNVISGDMSIFSIVAKHGLLKSFHEEMSVYRHHNGGITKSEKVIETHHQNRIELMQYLNAFHEGKFKDKVKEVIKYHQNSIAGLNKGNFKPDRYWHAKNWLNKKIKGI
jgi:glycosyltransferase involved in cell wall biosynthesis